MALVKRFGLEIRNPHPGVWWVLGIQQSADSDNLNRAICECVAKMQKAKG